MPTRRLTGHLRPVRRCHSGSAAAGRSRTDAGHARVGLQPPTCADRCSRAVARNGSPAGLMTPPFSRHPWIAYAHAARVATSRVRSVVGGFGSMRRVCRSSLSDRAPTPGSLLKRVRDGLLRDKSFGPHRDRACLLGHARYRLRLPAAVGSVNWLRSNSSKSSHRRDRDGRKRAAVLAAMELTVSRGGMGSNDDPLTDRSARPGRGSCRSRSRPAFPGPAFQRVLGALAPVPSRPAPERHRSPLARSMRIGRLSSASGGQRHRDNL